MIMRSERINNSFVENLPGDSNRNNNRRKVFNACYSFVRPKTPKNPRLLHFSDELAFELGLANEWVSSSQALSVLSGEKLVEGSRPYAMCYGGHQFGHWAGQLGDGRAINLFELEGIDKNWTIQLKGAGETPYSRNADGLAVLRSSIREHLCSEAMHHLGVPTTRSLSLVLSGDEVLRDMFYNGNEAYEKGAIVCRTAPSFIRFGNFQIHSARQEYDTLEALTDYTIDRHFQEIISVDVEKYVAFYRQVMLKTLDMITHWQRVGFVHGVMNTDNMSILGLTIDYGPYGWLDNYDANWTPNTTDRAEKRYRFGNQPQIALWNLWQLGNALFPLIKEADPLEEVLKEYQQLFQFQYRTMMYEKVGIFDSEAIKNEEVVSALSKLMNESNVDMTIFFRLLSNVKKKNKFRSFEDIRKVVGESFYDGMMGENIQDRWLKWFSKYINLLGLEDLDDDGRKEKMNRVNPKYVLRNYMAQMAIEDAENDNYQLLDELYEVLKNPYDEQLEHQKWFSKRPDWALNKAGCSMLSCSS